MRVKKENSNYDDLQTTLRKPVLQSHPFFQTCYPYFPLSSCLVPHRFLKRSLERGKSPLSSQVGSQAGQFSALKIWKWISFIYHPYAYHAYPHGKSPCLKKVTSSRLVISHVQVFMKITEEWNCNTIYNINKTIKFFIKCYIS